MNFSKLLYSFISLIVGLFFIFLGIIGLMIPFYPGFRTTFIRFLLDNSLLISLFGLGILIMGLSLVINVLISTRHRYYRYKGGSHTVEIDEVIIQQYLDTYWEKLFPKIEIPSRLMIKRNKVHIYADLPYFSLEDQKKLLQQIDRDLSQLFSKIFGYTHDFVLKISFDEIKK